MNNIIVNNETKSINRKYFSRIGLSLSSIFVITLLSQVLIINFLNFKPNMNFSLFISMIIMYCIGFPIFYFIIRRVPKYIPKEQTHLSFLSFFKYFLVSVSALYIFNFIGIIINFIIGHSLKLEIINPINKLITDVNKYVLILFVVIIGPIMEELIFRWIILNRVRVYGEKFAIFFTAFLFGLFHGNLYQFFYAFAIGIIFAYLCLKTGTFFYSAVLHIIINFMGSAIPLFFSNILNNSNLDYIQSFDNINNLTLSLLALYSIIIIICIVSGLIIFLKNIRYLNFKNAFYNYNDLNNLNKKAYLNFGMITFFLITIYQFISFLFISKI